MSHLQSKKACNSSDWHLVQSSSNLGWIAKQALGRLIGAEAPIVYEQFMSRSWAGYEPPAEHENTQLIWSAPRFMVKHKNQIKSKQPARFQTECRGLQIGNPAGMDSETALWEIGHQLPAIYEWFMSRLWADYEPPAKQEYVQFIWMAPWPIINEWNMN